MSVTPPRADYQIVLADPPWRFTVWDRVSGLKKAADFHYDTMTDSNLLGLPVAEWVAKNAFLALWVVDPQLPFALDLAKAWGFPKFVTVLFRWFKTTDDQLRLFNPTPRPAFGLGYHTRGGACEEVWLFKRGRGLRVKRHDIRKEFFAPLREHSRKPDEVPGWVVDLYGDKSRLELFSRTTRAGWDAYGHEAGKFDKKGTA